VNAGDKSEAGRGSCDDKGEKGSRLSGSEFPKRRGKNKEEGEGDFTAGLGAACLDPKGARVRQTEGLEWPGGEFGCVGAAFSKVYASAGPMCRRGVRG
jgi:hypothetical protein